MKLSGPKIALETPFLKVSFVDFATIKVLVLSSC
jgi:hypothetical protein